MDTYFWIANAVAVVSTACFGAILLSYLNQNLQNKKAKAKNEELEKENISLKVSLEHEQDINAKIKLDHAEALKKSESQAMEQIARQATSYENQLSRQEQNNKERIDELNSRLQKELDNNNERHAKEIEALNEKHAKELETLNAKITNDFKETMQIARAELFNMHTQKITETSNELVSKTLEKEIKPLRDEIAKYASENLKLNTVFSTNFESLRAMSDQLGKQAETLANALKGNKKIAGNWGESQLDFVLENSGLILGQNYEKQVYFTDENNQKFFLDAVVDFGNGKKAVIDAKCSLVHYLEFQNASSDEEGKEKAKELAKDVKNHIDTLSSKDYHKFSGAYEYIFMFIPNENMLYTALSGDKNLYQYAYEKGIFLCTPLTMLMALRTVYLCWQNLKIDENSRKIAQLAGSVYDKLYGFNNDFLTLERKIEDVRKTLDSAKNKLMNGKGNLNKKVEDLKVLGAKTIKNLSEYDFNKEEETLLTKDESLMIAKNQSEQNNA